MTAFKAANVTKYEAGGTGDNIISDGYIKTVEKIWMDSFTFTAVLTTADTIKIATIPANKKITSVEVFFPAITPTNSTINVGIVGDTDKFIDDAALTASPQVVRMNNNDGMSYITTASTDIYLSIGVAAVTAPTAGTIRTIVRYT
jgi:hypothetical protein